MIRNKFNREKIIREINKFWNESYPDSQLHVNQVDRSLNKFISMGSVNSKAINNIRNDRNEIKVVKWFGCYWIYFEIEFSIGDSENPDIFFSLSVFEGDNLDNVKNQLFRAEWDSFRNNKLHPQPHWHIQFVNKIEYVVNSFSDIIEENVPGFASFIEGEKNKDFNFEKMHFAMNAQWSNKKSHIHTIDSESSLINWFQGLVIHIKDQLEYANN